MLLSAIVVAFVPWKWPAANVAMLVYLGLVGCSGVALWRPRRSAWRLAVLTSLIGLALGISVVSGFVASWAYLRSVYGSFGLGASIVALILAATAFQVLGLHAALRLYALLRRDRRHFFGAGTGPLRAVGLLLALPVLLGLAIHFRYGLSPLAPLAAEERAQAMQLVRARLAAIPASAGVLSGVPAGPAPIAVKVFERGRVVARVFGRGADLREALLAAADALAARAPRDGYARGRIAIERSVAVGPVPSWPAFAVGLGFDPGRETLRVAGAEPERTIPTDELIRRDVYGAGAVLPFLPERNIWPPDGSGSRTTTGERVRSARRVSPIAGQHAFARARSSRRRRWGILHSGPSAA